MYICLHEMGNAATCPTCALEKQVATLTKGLNEALAEVEKIKKSSSWKILMALSDGYTESTKEIEGLRILLSASMERVGELERKLTAVESSYEADVELLEKKIEELTGAPELSKATSAVVEAAMKLDRTEDDAYNADDLWEAIEVLKKLRLRLKSQGGARG